MFSFPLITDQIIAVGKMTPKLQGDSSLVPLTLMVASKPLVFLLHLNLLVHKAEINNMLTIATLMSSTLHAGTCPPDKKRCTRQTLLRPIKTDLNMVFRLCIMNERGHTIKETKTPTENISSHMSTNMGTRGPASHEIEMLDCMIHIRISHPLNLSLTTLYPKDMGPGRVRMLSILTLMFTMTGLSGHLGLI